MLKKRETVETVFGRAIPMARYGTEGLRPCHTVPYLAGGMARYFSRFYSVKSRPCHTCHSCHTLDLIHEYVGKTGVKGLFTYIFCSYMQKYGTAGTYGTQG